jgi:1-acyl-sn-glycerol-3-phosphate acyltransferase
MAEFVYPPVIALARTMFKVQGLKFDIRGTENVPRKGGALLVSNHIGYLDFVFCGLTTLPSKRLVRFMAKESVFRHKVSGPLMRAMKHIPVDRSEGMHAYAHALDALRGGEIIGVFPEATISQSFTLKSFKSGAARLAMEAGVPLLPMALWGTQRLWTKGQPRNLGRSKFPITLRIGEPMHPQENEKAGALTRRLRLRVQELLDDAQRSYPDKPSGPADRWWQPAHLGGTAPTPEEAAERDREQQPLAAG